MKKIGLFAMLVLLSSLQIFAQNAPQTKEGAATPVVTEITVPDLSKLHRDQRKSFFVVREGQMGWVDQKSDGDVQLASMEYFLKDAASEELAAVAFYPLESDTACAIMFVDENQTKIYVILVDGKAFTTKNGVVTFRPLTDESKNITGLKVYLLSTDDPKRTHLKELDFPIKK